MIDAIPSRWLIAAALAAFVLGVAGLYIGWSAWAPMALLAGELLTILAAITLTTPSLKQSLAAQRAATSSETVEAGVPSAEDTGQHQDQSAGE
ncbi:MAG TPA: hypothetical protein VFZ66_14495 [Herpetosiphonaceae bacterium]